MPNQLSLYTPFSKENFYRMSTKTEPKKGDWHPADVLAALKKRGKTLSGLSRAHGYHATAAGKALKKPWPALEALIAAELGLMPEDIWPDRYDRPRQTQR
jgi:Ner family transcriptional regulator